VSKPEDKRETRKNAIAAAIILLGAGVCLALMPKIVLGLGAVSPWLGFGAGVAIILSFFAVFWLRARWQQRRSR
jgi:type II secretory pathway component PulF